jgi:hypothetical protein
MYRGISLKQNGIRETQAAVGSLQKKRHGFQLSEFYEALVVWERRGKNRSDMELAKFKVTRQS